jgi:hypothetical protein
MLFWCSADTVAADIAKTKANGTLVLNFKGKLQLFECNEATGTSVNPSRQTWICKKNIEMEIPSSER